MKRVFEVRLLVRHIDVHVVGEPQKPVLKGQLGGNIDADESTWEMEWGGEQVLLITLAKDNGELREVEPWPSLTV